MLCTIKDCDKTKYVGSLCQRHYKRLKRHGDPAAGARLRESHKLSKSSEYTSWLKMRQRCNDKKHVAYSYYGGRGIKVCERWENSFLAFYEDMGKKPNPKYTIDRINVNGDYKPSNCKWATRAEQSQNQRVQSNNRSGVAGVIWDPNRNKWRAELTRDGKKLINKRFAKKSEAIKAVKDALAAHA